MSLDNIMTKADLDDYTSEVKEYVGGGIRNVYKSIGSNGVKNLLPMTVDGIKAQNRSASWSGNTCTLDGVSFEIITDTNNNVIGIKVNRIEPSSTVAIFNLCYYTANSGDILSGCPSGGSSSTYKIYTRGGSTNDFGSSATISTGDVGISRLYAIAVFSEGSPSNLIFYPMIRLVSDTDPTFQPYAKTNLELTNQVDSVTDITDMTEVNDTTPYLYKVSSHNAVYDKLVGASFGVNQLIQNGNFVSTANWSVRECAFAVSNNVGTLTAQAANNNQQIYQPCSIISDHRYLVRVFAKKTGNVTQMIAGLFNSATAVATKIVDISTSFSEVSFIVSTSSSVDNFRIGHRTNISIGDELNVKNIQLTDLTLMFGTEIADYVYSLEQSTAGSGIVWLKSYGFFTNDYYPYNAGSIQSVKTSGKKVVGKNLVDIIPTTQTSASIEYNVTTNNLISSKGSATGNANLIMSFNHPIKFIKGVKYYIGLLNLKGNNLGGKIGIWLGEYELLIDYLTNENQHCISFTLNEDMEYSKLTYRHYLGSTNNYSGNLYISKTALSTYEPYTETTYPLGNNELRGIPKLVSNQLIYDGDVKTSDGVISRKYTEPIDLGTLNWVKHDTDLIFMATVPNSINPIANGNENAICSKYINYVGAYSTFKTLDKAFQYNNFNFSGSKYIIVRDSSYTDAATFKTAMSGVYLVAEKATPTTEVSIPFTSPQMVYSNGTEEYIDTRDVPIPVGGDREYVDIPEWMDNKYFNDLRANIMLNYAESQSF